MHGSYNINWGGKISHQPNVQKSLDTGSYEFMHRYTTYTSSPLSPGYLFMFIVVLLNHELHDFIPHWIWRYGQVMTTETVHSKQL